MRLILILLLSAAGGYAAYRLARYLRKPLAVDPANYTPELVKSRAQGTIDKLLAILSEIHWKYVVRDKKLLTRAYLFVAFIVFGHVFNTAPVEIAGKYDAFVTTLKALLAASVWPLWLSVWIQS